MFGFRKERIRRIGLGFERLERRELFSIGVAVEPPAASAHFSGRPAPTIAEFFPGAPHGVLHGGDERARVSPPDGATQVVSSPDGPMPQTHLNIVLAAGEPGVDNSTDSANTGPERFADDVTVALDGWWGHCNGWAAAGIMETEPNQALAVSPRNIDWSLMSGDLARDLSPEAFIVPEIDDEVIVAFAQGDLRYAYIDGTLWDSADSVPPENGRTEQSLDGDDRVVSEWKYVPVRRVALLIQESLYHDTQFAVFEPNNEPLWSQLRVNIAALMHDLFHKLAFQRATASAADCGKCDAETTAQDDRGPGIVSFVGVAPVKPAEFGVVRNR